MVFDLEKLLPKEHKELDPEKRKFYVKFYTKVLEKYGYHRDKQNASAFDALADYFGQWYAGTEGEASMPEKGLFLFGQKGTGKTKAMLIFSGLFKVEFVTIEELTIAFTTGREEAFWNTANQWRNKNLIIDDVCNEREVKAFGNKIPLPEFFKIREEKWKYEGRYTFFTSNARGREEITQMYGDTITSRLLGSCNFIKLDGHDRRIS